MPTIQIETSIGIGATANLFNGAAYEYARTNRVASVGLTAAATGSFATLQSGSDVVAEEFPPFVLTTFPVIPDHFHFNDQQGAGDRLKLQVRNPTGGAIIHRAIAMLSGP